jgi:hypothetical protein
MKKLKSIFYRVEEIQISRIQFQQKHYILYFIPIKKEIIIKNNGFKLVYVAIDEDGDVLHVNESRDALEYFVMDCFGINPDRKYNQPDECLGFTRIEYSEFEDDLVGYWKFKDTMDGKGVNVTRVNLWCKELNERV